MRNLKRALSLLLSSTMVLGMLVMGGSAAGYQDVDDSNKNQEAIEVLQAVGIMTGDQNGNFNPDGSITRNEMAVIMAHLLNLDYDYYRGTNPFTDVPEWAAPYVAACAAEGVVAGIGNGQFGGNNKVTAAEASLMLMKALGYFQNAEDFGTDWQVATIRQASYINLFDRINATAESALTRAQVAQLVLNGLKSDMVSFTGDKGIQIGDVTVGYRAEYTSKTSSAAKYNSLVGGKTDIAQQGQYYIQLGEELYNGKLTMRADTDAFQRPATTWTYNSNTIGTYVDFDLMVGEYTTSVTGKELYDVVGKTAFDKYDFYGYVNGEENDLCDQIAKNNANNVEVARNDDIGNGALTQVFVDNDAEEVVVTVINTYLAEAVADYNEKKDSATFKIYNNVDGSYIQDTASGENFDVAEIKEGDFVLVTYAKEDIQTISDVEILSEVEITKFTTGGSVTVDGTKYDASDIQGYDHEILNEYANSNNNLKDTIYNVYLDQYGYAIGVDVVEAPNKYVFITGTDDASSNLSTKTWSANAIFMDGTSAVIEVEDGKDTFGTDSALINKWFKYTVDNNDVYSLTPVAESAIIGKDADSVAQYRTASNNVGEINDKHISLLGNGDDKRVYGNEDTVYLLAELDKVTTDKDYAVIKGVDEVVTGVENASFTVWGWSGVSKETGVSYSASSGADNYGNKVLANGTYALYGDNGYVIAAVVVGESDSVSKSIAYAIDSSVSGESYNKTDKTWTWTRDVIINGQEVELTETRDKNESVLEDKMVGGKWYTVKYYADGTVKDVVEYNTPNDGDDYQNTIAGAVAQILADNNSFIVSVPNVAGSYTLKGNTLYDDNTDQLGFLVAADVKIALSQVVNSKRTVTYDEGSTTLKAILEDLNENAASYDFNAVIENGRATSVIIIDNRNDGGYEGPNGSTNDKYEAKVSYADNTVYITGPAPAGNWTSELVNNIFTTMKAALEAEGYAYVSWGGTATWKMTVTNANGAPVEFTAHYDQVV